MSSMYDIPKTPQKIRERIRRYERKLRKEKEESGMIHDGAGKRYFLGPSRRPSITTKNAVLMFLARRNGHFHARSSWGVDTGVYARAASLVRDD